MSDLLLDLARTLRRLRDGPCALERLMMSDETDEQRNVRLETDAKLEAIAILAPLKPGAHGPQ